MRQTHLVTHTCPPTQEGLVWRRGSQPDQPSEGLMWPLCPVVAMGIVPVLQEAGRAVSCFEEGLRVVSLQSACPERGRKPRAGLPLLLGVRWSRAHAQPARRGCCGNAASGKRQTVQCKKKKKKKTGRKRVAPSSTDLESHPVIKIPPSDKNSEPALPSHRLPSPRAQPFLRESRTCDPSSAKA